LADFHRASHGISYRVRRFPDRFDIRRLTVLAVVFVVALSLLGCPDDDYDEEEFCDHTRPGGLWHPPGHTTSFRLNLETIACEQTDTDYACREQGCYCGGVVTTNSVTVSVASSACADFCTGLDEATCMNEPNCSVARENGTDTYLGCYRADDSGYTFACAMYTDAGGCARAGDCVPLYRSTGQGTWQFTTCIDEA
jgi:hypothetical protein